MPTNYNVNGTDLESFFVGRANTSVLYTTPSSLWAWGTSDTGQLGLGAEYNNTNVYFPERVKPYNDWKAIKGNSSTKYTFGIRNNGTLWSWGDWGAGNGQLGYPANSDVYAPRQIGTDTNWDKLVENSYGGYGSALAIKTDGSLWSWGALDRGGLGTNNQTPRSSPVQVGTLTNWFQISQTGGDVIARKTDGTIWVWGNADSGALGQNAQPLTHRSSPIQVGGLTIWDQVSASWSYKVATRTDGTIWVWGVNINGVLGQNAQPLTHRSSPIQVGALTNWSKICTGGYQVASIKTDGTLWMWGENDYGSLGDGTLIFRSSPVQIGALTNWSKLAMDEIMTLAIKTDGTLWGWGQPLYSTPDTGQYAKGVRFPATSSPVQITDWNDWNLITMGYGYILGTRNIY